MKKVLVELFICTLFASFFIFYKFNQIPNKLSLDEVEFTKLALSLKNSSYVPYSQIATGHATLYFYIILFSFKLFGVNNFALRFPAGFFGIANVILFYFISRLIFFCQNKNLKKSFASFVPFLLTALFASLRWNFTFARFSFEATFLLFLELSSMLALLIFWKNNKTRFLVISAIFAGLAFHSYYPGRIFFFLPIFALFFHSPVKTRIVSILLFLGVFSIIILPLVVYLIRGEDIRFQQQFFFADRTLSVPKKVAYFAINTIKLSLMFTLTGDLNGRHNYPGKPILNPIISSLFLFGFFIALFNIKNFYTQFFLVYLLLSLIPATLTYPWENPNLLRSFTSIIPVMYFIGYALVNFLDSARMTKINLLLVLIVIIGICAISVIYEQRTYFTYQMVVFRQAFEYPGTIKRILSLKLWEKTHFY